MKVLLKPDLIEGVFSPDIISITYLYGDITGKKEIKVLKV